MIPVSRKERVGDECQTKMILTCSHLDGSVRGLHSICAVGIHVMFHISSGPVDLSKGEGMFLHIFATEVAWTVGHFAHNYSKVEGVYKCSLGLFNTQRLDQLHQSLCDRDVWHA